MTQTKLLIVGLLVALAVSMTGVATASALEPHFFVCSKTTGGKYEDSACSKEGSPKEWELKELTTGESLSVTTTGGPYKLKTTILGGLDNVTIECAKESGTGSTTNPAGKIRGLILLLILWSSCTVSGGGVGSCTITHSIHWLSHGVLSWLLGLIPWILFEPDGPSGTPFAVITFTGCKNSILNKSFEVLGEVDGKVENSTGKVKFIAGEMQSLVFAGEPATLEGESLLLTDGGGTVQVLLS